MKVMTRREAMAQGTHYTGYSTFPLMSRTDDVGDVFPAKPGTGRCFSIHKGRVHIQFWIRLIEDKPAVMKVKGYGR